ncbi:MAG: ABC transporter permease [Vicinamibacteraceae bacterium]|nr:ABC transporter permease [Vicinamibacteraceae bacterium]
MTDLWTIAIRNLLRYRRRTLLTGSLIALGVVFVIVFGASASAFKGMMIGQMTDSVLAHIQVHRRGYVASLENLPLTLTLDAGQVAAVERALEQTSGVEAWSGRLKFAGMFSNYAETTGIRVNGVDPVREFATVPLLPSRILKGEARLDRGGILVPELIAAGMNVKVGDTVVLIATNKDGSVNAGQYVVLGLLESVTGPGGRDAYIHLDDAIELLRLEQQEVSEIAIRLERFGDLDRVARDLNAALGSGGPKGGGKKGGSPFEVHTWEALSPFYNVAMMVDLLTMSIRVALIAIVLISVMNVMLMAVFERVKEIGTIAAMGTLPGRIMSMFVLEGFSLGLFGAAAGVVLGVAVISGLRLARPTFDFGRQTGLVLSPSVNIGEILLVTGIVVAVAVVASFQPAFKAARLEPVDALRHT